MVLYEIVKHALMITVFVFVMMLIVDFVDMFSEKRLSEVMTGGIWRQYAAASFLGATPGCLGAFMSVSLYVHGLLSFGALTGAMIATSGDEAFVMLAKYDTKRASLYSRENSSVKSLISTIGKWLHSADTSRNRAWSFGIFPSFVSCRNSRIKFIRWVNISIELYKLPR